MPLIFVNYSLVHSWSERCDYGRAHLPEYSTASTYTPYYWGRLVFLRPLPKIHTSHQYLEDLKWFETIFKKFARAIFEAIEVKGWSRLNFEATTWKFCKLFQIFQILTGGMNFREMSQRNQTSSAVRSAYISFSCPNSGLNSYVFRSISSYPFIEGKKICFLCSQIFPSQGLFFVVEPFQ